MGMEGFSAERTQTFQAPIKLAQPLPAPELRAKKFTDTISSFFFHIKNLEIWQQHQQTQKPEHVKAIWIKFVQGGRWLAIRDRRARGGRGMIV